MADYIGDWATRNHEPGEEEPVVDVLARLVGLGALAASPLVATVSPHTAVKLFTTSFSLMFGTNPSAKLGRAVREVGADVTGDIVAHETSK